MLDAMKTSDWVIAFATLLGPILAVQAQKWIERATERKNKKYNVFSTLMITRGTQLATEHVAALNSIDLIFSPTVFSLPWTRRRDNAVLGAWHLYFQHLELQYDKSSEASFMSWNGKRNDLFIDLLMAMARSVGYSADKERVLGAYHPDGHWKREQTILKALDNAAKVLAGEQDIRMALTSVPVSQEVADLQLETQQKILALISDGILRVQVNPAVTSAGSSESSPNS